MLSLDKKGRYDRFKAEEYLKYMNIGKTYYIDVINSLISQSIILMLDVEKMSKNFNPMTFIL